MLIHSVIRTGSLFILVLSFWGRAAFAEMPLAKTPLSQESSQIRTEAPAKKEGDSKAREEFSDFRDPFKSFLPFKEVVERQLDSEGILKPVLPTPKIKEEEFNYSSLHVTGLVWGTEKPKAIINEQVFGIGDEVNGAKILNISKEGILFEFKNKEFLMKREMTSASAEKGVTSSTSQQTIKKTQPQKTKKIQPKQTQKTGIW